MHRGDDHKPPAGMKFALGVEQDGELVGVATVGLPPGAGEDIRSGPRGLADHLLLMPDYLFSQAILFLIVVEMPALSVRVLLRFQRSSAMAGGSSRNLHTRPDGINQPDKKSRLACSSPVGRG